MTGAPELVALSAAASFCDGCGKSLAAGDHAPCRDRRAATDPPRYCTVCGRKLAVQVLPVEFRARCVRCGPLQGDPGAGGR